jgi:hypothetical protein
MLNQLFKRALALLIGAVWLGGAPLAEAGQWLVIDAEGTTLAPGTLLVEQQKVALADGARLTLLADDGQTLKLVGPYSGIPEQKSTTSGTGKNLVVIASLLQGHSQPASTLGAFRTSSRRTPPAGAVDVDRSGKQCLINDPVVLWRGNAMAQESVTLTDAWNKTLISLIWPMGEEQLAIPARYFNDGQDYRIQRGNRKVQLQVHKAAQPTDNPAALAAWMAESGCQAQALSVLQDL